MATQNPIESEGTYPLPEAQVDRFMLKILVGYPEHDEELTVVQRSLTAPPELRQRARARAAARPAGRKRSPSTSIRASSATRCSSRPRRASRASTGSTRWRRYISYGASPRGPISLVQSARALAFIRGRDYVVVQDVESLAKDALRHRLVLSYQALAEQVDADKILDAVIEKVIGAGARPEQAGDRGLTIAPETDRVRSARRTGRGPGALPETLLRALDLTIGRRIEGMLAGDHRSSVLGAGSELAQVRPYVAGRRRAPDRVERDRADRRDARARSTSPSACS